jgi:hypothetical protein
VPSQTDLDRTIKVLAGASLSEAAVACGAGVLAVLGLVGVAPALMTPIAVIAIGASLLVEGPGFAARVSQLRSLARTRQQVLGVGGGVSAEVAGGLAGVVLGILALLGISPTVLEAAAAITFGAALLFSSGAEAEVEALIARVEARVSGSDYASVQVANSANALVGIGSIALGILVLAEVGSASTLILVALLGVAASLTLSGSAMGAELGLVAKRH